MIGHVCGYGGVLNTDGQCPKCEVALETDDLWWTMLAADVGRNAPCPCGSGRKAKKCHG